MADLGHLGTAFITRIYQQQMYKPDGRRLGDKMRLG